MGSRRRHGLVSCVVLFDGILLNPLQVLPLDKALQRVSCTCNRPESMYRHMLKVRIWVAVVSSLMFSSIAHPLSRISATPLSIGWLKEYD